MTTAAHPGRVVAPTTARAESDETAQFRAYRRAAATCALVALAPLLLTTYAPLVDYPNHLARAYILRHFAEVPAFAADYVLAPAPIPNVAIDVAVLGLQYVFPPVLAGKAFLAGVVLLWCLGVHLLGRAIHGRPTWLALPCMLLAYHGAFQYGFVNYSLGLGAYFVGTAAWLARRGRWTPLGVAGVSALAVFAYLSHLSSYALFGATAVAVTCYDLARRRVGLAQALLGGVPFLPPLVLFAAFMRGGGRVGGLVWNSVAGKAVAVFTVLRGYFLPLDVAVLAGLALVVAASLAAARRAGRISAHGATLAASLFLFALFLACPKDLFTSGGADVRVVPAAAVLFVLSWRLTLPPRAAGALLGAAVALLLVRTASIATAWVALDARVARAVALIDRVPVGSRLLPLFKPGEGVDRAKWDRVLEHAPYYAIIDRQAYVPILFAVRSQQPLVARRYAWSTITAGDLLADHLDEFDHVWAFGPTPAQAERLRGCCDLVGADGGALLWRVRRP